MACRQVSTYRGLIRPLHFMQGHDVTVGQGAFSLPLTDPPP